MQRYATPPNHSPLSASGVKLLRSGYDDQKLSGLLGVWAGLSNDPLLVGLSADCVEHGPQGCGHPTHIADVRKHSCPLSPQPLPAATQAVTASRYATVVCTHAS